MRRVFAAVWILLLALGACQTQKEAAEKGAAAPKGEIPMTIKVTSSAFEENGLIPAQYTCDGQDVSPPLSFAGLPDGTGSLALIADDPDAPRGTWVHWVLYNLPPDLTALEEDIPDDEILESGARHGITDFGSFGYGGPCPPSGTHRYFFKVYALDTMLALSGRVTKDELLNAMEGHVLAEGQLMGRYRRR